MSPKYVETYEDCLKRLHGVCEGCGGKLEPLETVDNSGNPTHWVGCKHCMCFRLGVDEKYFKIARQLVDSGEVIPYSFKSRHDADDDEYWLDSQTAGLSHKIARIHKMLEEGE